MGVGLRTVGLLFGVLTMHAVSMHQSSIRVLRVGRNQVVLPMRQVRGRGPNLATIERSALEATRGGQVEDVVRSVWAGQPVWMCIVSEGRSVWHVMIDQTTLRPISKIVVPR